MQYKKLYKQTKNVEFDGHLQIKLPWIPEAPGCSLVEPKRCVAKMGIICQDLTNPRIGILASDCMHKTSGCLAKPAAPFFRFSWGVWKSRGNQQKKPMARKSRCNISNWHCFRSLCITNLYFNLKGKFLFVQHRKISWNGESMQKYLWKCWWVIFIYTWDTGSVWSEDQKFSFLTLFMLGYFVII